MRLKNLKLFALFTLLGCAVSLFANTGGNGNETRISGVTYCFETPLIDTVPLNDRFGDFLNFKNRNLIDLEDPGVIKKEVTYDPATNQYILTEKMGDENYRPPTYMTFDEYMEWNKKEQEAEYFSSLSQDRKNRSVSGIIDPLTKFNIQDNLVDRLFGGTKVDIRPQGSIGLTFGWNYSLREDPGLVLSQQGRGRFNFDMDINMSVQGKIGEKLNLNFNYNSAPTFDFDNQMKLQYDPTQFSEDDIIQNIEAGDVTMPLRGTLIPGIQSLFGLRLDTKWGPLNLSTVIAQQKSDREELVVKGGAQFQEYEVYADDYEENRHFFISHYNRDAFEESLVKLPKINNVFKLERVQLFVTGERINQAEQLVDIVAFSDMGEAERLTNSGVRRNPIPPTDFQNRPLPDNSSNELFDQITNDDRIRLGQEAVFALQNPPYNMQQGKDFEKVTARYLEEGRDYTIHPELGYISISSPVQPDFTIGISYQYSYNGEVYQVGEFSNKVGAGQIGTTTDPNTGELEPDTSNIEQTVIFTKMLKSATQRVDIPLWDLMMKNVYNIGAYNVNPDDFEFGIYYDEPGIGYKQFLPQETGAHETPLLTFFNMDNLNSQLDPCPDGEFDFIPGLTIQPRNGRIMFPLLEPFGDSIVRSFDQDRRALGPKYSYQVLYDSTVTRAREYPDKNRFLLKGTYKSDVSNEIQLNAIRIPPGTLKVTSGGKVLREGSDYKVDYDIGRVTILNDAYVSSGVPVKVEFEDRSLFGFQQKTLIGLRGDYAVNKNLTIGGTYMHLFERPYTQKVNYGDDPINNRIVGLDVAWSKDVPFITKMVDALPFIDTKAESSVNFTAEAAALFPGHSKAINQGGPGADNGGIVMIDDFDGSFPEISLSAAANQGWNLASVPQNDSENNNPLFPEAKEDSIFSGVNRARLSWFLVDDGSRGNDAPSDPYTNQVEATEIFRQSQQQSFQNIRRPIVFHYDPTQRGPYNFDTPNDGTDYSSGLEFDGTLKEPATRWAGVTRSIQNNDFEATNVEFVEFWMMSPYHDHDIGTNGLGAVSPDAAQQQGEIYINLGNVSEDVLKDSELAYENGLPGSSPTSQNRRTSTSPWGEVPASRPINKAFDTDPQTRTEQDIGLDGIDDAVERQRWGNYLSALQGGLDNNVYNDIQQDPANDNFEFFNSSVYPSGTSVVEKYAKFNNPEGNSPVNRNNSTTRSSRLQPDSEDLNDDKTLNQSEAYFQYKIPIKWKGGLELEDHPFIKDTVQVKRGGETYRLWYNFKVPISEFESAVGGIQDFRSIRFIRMYFKGFEAPTTFPMVDLKLTRSNWRKYKRSLKDNAPIPIDLYPPADFQLADVNLEENITKEPFNYILPEGIQREQTVGGINNNQLQNESSVSMIVNDLSDGDARGIYRLLRPDLRFYERVKMFVHAEATDSDALINDDEMTIFMRLGSDFENNYFEYEIPLKISDPALLPPDDEPDALAYSQEVWRNENLFDFSIAGLISAKQERNSNNIPFDQVYEKKDSVTNNLVNNIKVKGNPDLGKLAGIMIGVRNPLDDGVPHSVEVWANELSATGLSEEGGVAAIGRLDMNLADFGQLTVAGSYEGIGYGGVDQDLQSRNLDQIVQYDIAASAELGKFFGDKSGIKVPVLAQYSKGVSTPKFDPNSGDIELDKLLENTDNTLRDSVKKVAQIRQEIKTISVTNLRKERTKTDKKPMPWDISNFSTSYTYTNKVQSDPKTELAESKDHYGTLDYNYSISNVNIKPFKKLIKKDKYLKLFSEFNFNPLPQSFTFSTVMDKDLHKSKRRFAGTNELNNTFYEKKFLWDRDYNLTWDFTKALKFNFNATNRSIIDELKNYDDEGNQRSRSELTQHNWKQVRNLGRTRNYNHNATASYQLPFKLIPYLDFINARAQYNVSYGWTGASLLTQELGNVIQNTQKRDLSGDMNFERLYNKNPYLKKINRRSRSKRKNRRGQAQGSKKKKEAIDKDKSKKKKKKSSGPSMVEKALIRPFLLLRNARFRYSEDYSTIIPGFTPQSKLFGLSQGFGAPGWEFAAGAQPGQDWFDQAANPDNRWITEDFFLNQKVQQNYSQTIDGKLVIEPINNFRITMDLRKKYTENHSEYFKDYDAQDGEYKVESKLPQDIGSMEITYFSANTMFGQDPDGIDLFRKLEANREIISQRIGIPGSVHAELDQRDYTEGYGKVHQDVLIPAFISAYSGADPNNVKLDIFKTFPLPNWTVDYSGLGKLGFMKDIFERVSIKHGYKSTLRVASFRTDLNYDRNQPVGLDNVNPETKNYYSRLEIPDVIISEGFSPLFEISVETKNKMSANFGITKTRDLEMNLFTYTLAETKETGYKAGFEYTLQDIEFGFLKSKKKRKRKAKDDKKGLGNQFLGRQGGRQFGNSNPKDLKMIFNMTLNDGITINHLLDQNIHERIRGQYRLVINPSVDYQMNSRLNMSLFVNYNRTVPKTSQTPPTTNIESGLKIEFTLN